jgi:EVE domain
MANSFVFQSVPDRFDLRKGLRPGESDIWLATRYRSEMHFGDIVFFWMAGDKHLRGMYGWGRIVSSPYLKPDSEAHEVNVKYEQKFTKPILASSIEQDPVLKQMLILRAPQATNFLLSPDEAKRLAKLLRERGEGSPWASEVKNASGY